MEKDEGHGTEETMKKWVFGLALAVALSAAAGIAEAQQKKCVRKSAPEAVAEKPAAACDGTYGTKVSWLTDEKRAAEKARAENRFVMILHISGELDDPEKT